MTSSPGKCLVIYVTACQMCPCRCFFAEVVEVGWSGLARPWASNPAPQLTDCVIWGNSPVSLSIKFLHLYHRVNMRIKWYAPCKVFTKVSVRESFLTNYFPPSLWSLLIAFSLKCYHLVAYGMTVEGHAYLLWEEKLKLGHTVGRLYWVSLQITCLHWV